MLRWVHKSLESPRIYVAVQSLLGSGGNSLDPVYARGFGGSTGRVLDVGCGPVQETPLPRGTLVGLDINPRYVERYAAVRDTAACKLRGVVASAAAMPFAEGVFDECRSVAVMHHLPDELVRSTFRQMYRILKPGGRIALFDMVRPDSFRAGPLATVLCALDRGRHVRTGNALQRLAETSCPGAWESDTFTYAWPRLHGILLMIRKPAP